MPAYSTTEATDWLTELFQTLAYTEADDDTDPDLAELVESLEDVTDAAEAGWLVTEGQSVEVRLADGRRFLVTAQEVRS